MIRTPSRSLLRAPPCSPMPAAWPIGHPFSVTVVFGLRCAVPLGGATPAWRGRAGSDGAGRSAQQALADMANRSQNGTATWWHRPNGADVVGC
jgi:hypothetical protein